MTQSSDSAPADEGLRWELKRNCSMSPQQLGAVFCSLAVLGAVIAAGFWLIGAPLIMAFAGLEALALGIAFVAFGRHAGDGEMVVLRRSELVIETVRASRVEVQRLDPAWVRVKVERRSRGSLTNRVRVALLQNGKEVEVGRLVNDERRSSFARELRGALAGQV